MEPSNHSPENTREQQPTPIEYSFPAQNPETKPERPLERTPEADQELHRAATSALATSSVALPAPVADPVAASDSDNQQVAAPSAAADDDLIEKEWVDKAKKIITDTRDDPHGREQQVGKLQIEYLRKRYGKELGERDER